MNKKTRAKFEEAIKAISDIYLKLTDCKSTKCVECSHCADCVVFYQERDKLFKLIEK